MLTRLLHDTAASGAWNMAVDEAILTSAAETGLCTLRFYAWEEPTLSLGYFQDYADRERHAASRGCPCVRRASGGGAILHDREITYSFAVPPSVSWAKKHLTLYEAFHAALVEVLATRGFSATLCQPAGSQRDHIGSFLCFERRAPGDVMVGEIKVAGSAQRRLGGAVVQHGSILFKRSAAAPELAGLNDLDELILSQDDFLQAWLEELTEKMGLEILPGSLSDAERLHAVRLVEEKYGSEAWNRHRGRQP